MQLAPSAFFLLGLLVWAIRSIRTDQAEATEHEAPQVTEPAE